MNPAFYTSDIQNFSSHTSHTSCSLDTQDPSQAQQIGKTLATIARDTFNALNERDLEPSSPRWKDNLASYFKCEPDLVLYNGASLTIEEFLLSLRSLIEVNPDYNVKIADFTAYLSKDGTHAETFMNMEISGVISASADQGEAAGDGVVRHAVGLMEFAIEEGKWVCSRYRAMRGLVEAPGMI